MITRFIIIFILTHIPWSVANADEQLPYNTKPNDFVTVKNQDLSAKKDTTVNVNVYDKVDLKNYNYPDCKDVPLVVNQCIKAACKQTTKIGTIYRQIKGATAEAGCEYSERTPGYGGMDCIFKADVMDKVQIKFDHFLDSFDGSLLGPTDSNEFKQIITQSCKTVGDSELQNVVTIDKNSPIPAPSLAVVAPPVAAPNTPIIAPTSPSVEAPAVLQPALPDVKAKDEPTKPVSGIAAPRQLTSEPHKAGKNNIETSYLTKSAMFTDEELVLINQVIENLGKDQAGAASPAEAIKSSRSFFLDSILYYNQDHWTVWVNGNKLSSDVPSSGLEVAAIDKLTATLKWTTPSLEKVSPDWKRKLIYVNESKFTSLDNRIIVEVGSANSAIVTFNLAPNQLFEVYEMKIIEGAPPPAPKENTVKNITGGKTATKPKANNQDFKINNKEVSDEKHQKNEKPTEPKSAEITAY